MGELGKKHRGKKGGQFFLSLSFNTSFFLTTRASWCTGGSHAPGADSSGWCGWAEEGEHPASDSPARVWEGGSGLLRPLGCTPAAVSPARLHQAVVGWAGCFQEINGKDWRSSAACTREAVQGVDEMVGENHTELEMARDGDPLVTRWRSAHEVLYVTAHIFTTLCGGCRCDLQVRGDGSERSSDWKLHLRPGS